MAHKRPAHERAMDHVAYDTAGPGCWLWTGTLRQGDRHGRPHMHVGDDPENPKRTEYVSRLMYAAHVGPIPDGLNVLHTCDQHLCIRPDHFFLGTNDDNIADRVAKGRSRNRWTGPIW